MPDESTASSPAMDIINNPGNPSHEALHNEGHADHARVKSLVESLFAQSNPELDKAIRGEQQATRSSIPGAPNAEGEPAQAAGAPMEYIPTPSEVEVTSRLHDEYGDQFDDAMAAGGRVLVEFFPSLEAMDQFTARTGLLDDVETLHEAMRLLVKIGRLRR